MAYATMKASELVELLKQRDQELAISQQNARQNQATIPQANIPLPEPWNLNAKDQSESFENFLMFWNNYKRTMSVEKQSQATQVGIFWSALGSEAMKRCLKDWKFTEAQTADVATIIETIKEKLTKQRVPIIDRLRFTKAKQDPDEHLTTFVERIEKLADHCKYGDLKKDLSVQQVLSGMSDSDFREELLKEEATTGKLTWEVLKEKVNRKKAREDQLIALTEDFKKNSIEETVKKISKPGKSKENPCKYCGYVHKHDKKSCPAYGQVCRKCKGENHFAAVCLKNKAKDESEDSDSDEEEKKPKKKSNKSKSKKHRVKEIKMESSTSSSSSEEEEILKIRTIKKQSKPTGAFTNLSLKINGGYQDVSCQLDTGSMANVIGINNLKSLIARPKIQEASIEIRDIQDNKIELIGECEIKCRHKNKKYVLVFKVVQFDHPPLISEEACRILGLVKYCNPTSSTEESTTDKKQRKAKEKKPKQSEKFLKTDRKHTEMTSSTGNKSREELPSNLKCSLQKVKKKIVKGKAKSLDKLLKNLEVNQKAAFGSNGTPKTPTKKNYRAAESCFKKRLELKPQIPSQAIQQNKVQVSTFKSVNAETVDQVDNGSHSFRTPAIKNSTPTQLYGPSTKSTSHQPSPNINKSTTVNCSINQV
jgi:hypothetical protein